MKGKYTIKLQSNNVDYEITVERNITVIRGDSGTGKTTFVKKLESYVTNKIAGIKSDIKLECKVDVDVITVRSRVDWEGFIRSHDNSILIFDEDFTKVMMSHTFAEYVLAGNNYFVLITREPLSHLPYSVNEIYKFESQKINKVYNRAVPVYCNAAINNISNRACDSLITEDSNSGYQFFSKLSSISNCCYAGGNANILNKINKTYGDTIAVVDGAAFGGYIDRVIKNIREINNRHIYIYAPESFENLLIMANVYDHTSKIMSNIYDLVEYENASSWEQFFTDYIRSVTNGTKYQYNKTRLNKIYLENADKIKAVIPDNIRILLGL